MREKLTVIKVGGKIVEEEATLNRLLDDFATIEGHKVLVHGGGRSATKIAAQLGIESKMVNGRRITDSETLKVVTMVYGGLVNKNVVAGLQARGVNALGLTGADMNVMRSVKRPVKEVDYGFVGDVEKVDASLLSDLIYKGVVPVMAPLTHDGKGHMLNTNADTIAGETAKALATLFDVTLVFCFEKKGVLRDENDDDSVIPLITPAEFKQYVADGIIQGGMIPKLENSFAAIDAGVSEVIITLASAISGEEGTRIFRNDILPLKDKLFRLALRITLDRAEAEDVVQDTMIRVWNKRDEWQQFESVEAYCLIVAKNLAIDRSQKKDAQNVELTPEMAEEADTSGPYDRLVNNERMKIIHRLIDELPEKQRLIMQLRDIEGESYKDIAKVLQLTEEQVKVNLFRARQKVKQRYIEIDEYGL